VVYSEILRDIRPSKKVNLRLRRQTELTVSVALPSVDQDVVGTRFILYVALLQQRYLHTVSCR